MNNKIPRMYLMDNKIINKNRIISFLKKKNDISEIEEYVDLYSKWIKSHPEYKTRDVIDVLEACNYRINQINGLDKLPIVVEKTKKEVSNLNNIEVIYTPYFINDKNKEGFRHDVTYIKIKNELYEVRDVRKVLSFLSNKAIIKDLSEYEIIKFIQEHSDLMKNNYLNRQEGKITSEEVEEEIRKESDSKIRIALESHKDAVIKERQKLEEYISKNNPGVTVQYSVNSNEERIYIVGDELIKFEGPNRNLQIISELDVETMQRDFESKQGYNEEISYEKIGNIKGFEIYQDKLFEIIEEQYQYNKLPIDKLEFLINFLDVWISAKENNEEINENLDTVAQDWYEKVNMDPNILEESENLSEIFVRIKEYKKKNGKSKIYEINNTAFISLFAVLETSLVLGLIIALISLFK